MYLPQTGGGGYPYDSPQPSCFCHPLLPSPTSRGNRSFRHPAVPGFVNRIQGDMQQTREDEQNTLLLCPAL